MILQKSEIILSPKHPSLLENTFTKSNLYAPIVVNQDLLLIDGYRRYRMEENDEIFAVQMEISELYPAAFEMNRNTRTWEEIDIFLWKRWAESLGAQTMAFPDRTYPESLNQAPETILAALANRKLLLGQVVRILQAPPGTWLFFTEILSSNVRFNVNETAHFIDLIFDLANRWQTKNLSEVLKNEELKRILSEERLPRQTGEALLKAMRNLRYPLYQRKSEELSTAWEQLNLEKWHAKKSQFLDRGVLEITIRARSEEEMSTQVKALYESLSSQAWGGIWNL